MDVKHVLVARFTTNRLAESDEHLVTDLIHRDEVDQVSWAKRPNPLPRRPGRRGDAAPEALWQPYQLDVLVFMNHRASDLSVAEISNVLRAIGTLTELEVRHPDQPPPQPVRVTRVAPPGSSVVAEDVTESDEL